MVAKSAGPHKRTLATVRSGWWKRMVFKTGKEVEKEGCGYVMSEWWTTRVVWWVLKYCFASSLPSIYHKANLDVRNHALLSCIAVWQLSAWNWLLGTGQGQLCRTSWPWNCSPWMWWHHCLCVTVRYTIVTFINCFFWYLITVPTTDTIAQLNSPDPTPGLPSEIIATLTQAVEQASINYSQQIHQSLPNPAAELPSPSRSISPSASFSTITPLSTITTFQSNEPLHLQEGCQLHDNLQY